MPPKGKSLALTTNDGNQNQSVSKDVVKCKNSYYDKQSGSYGRVTTKESVSSGDYTNRGRAGYKDEYNARTTVRVGDKSGYTEYSKQEKFTKVNYGAGDSNCGDGKMISDSDGGYAKDYGYSSDDSYDDDGNEDHDFDSYEDDVNSGCTQDDEDDESGGDCDDAFDSYEDDDSDNNDDDDGGYDDSYSSDD